MHTKINKFLFFILCFTSPLFAKRKSLCPAPKNFKGTLTTLRNHEYPISHISIANRQRCIPVYRAPCKTDTIICNLCYNPKKFEVHLNLKDIAAIEMPYPYAQWKYRSCKKKIKDTYILIKIFWHDKKKAPTQFLIQPKRRLYGHMHRKIRSSNTCIPFRGFKKITIEG